MNLALETILVTRDEGEEGPKSLHDPVGEELVLCNGWMPFTDTLPASTVVTLMSQSKSAQHARSFVRHGQGLCQGRHRPGGGSERRPKKTKAMTFSDLAVDWEQKVCMCGTAESLKGG